MSREQAFAYLEELQARAYLSLGVAPRDFSIGGLDQQNAHVIARSYLGPDASSGAIADFAEDMIRSVQEHAAQLPTRYEDPRVYGLLSSYQESIESAVRHLGIEPVPLVNVGTLPTGQVNALTIAVPGSQDYIVAFDRGLSTFALLLSKAVAQVFPYELTKGGGASFSVDEERLRNNLRSRPDIADRFTEVVLAYAVFGEPARARPYILPDRATNELTRLLKSSLELFVLGHEYGHALAGHLDDAMRTAAVLPDVNVEEVAFAWGQEYEADIIGLHLSTRAMSIRTGVDLSLSFWGAPFFFHCMMIMERAVSLLHYGEEGTIQLGSHPPHAVRRGVLSRALVDATGTEQAQGAIQLAKQLEIALEELWNTTRSRIWRRHAEGARPAPAWELAERESVQ